MRGIEIHVLPFPHLIGAGGVVQVASVKHIDDSPRSSETACQLDAFSTVLRTCMLNRTGDSQSTICGSLRARFVYGKAGGSARQKGYLACSSGKKEMGTTHVLSFTRNWLPDNSDHVHWLIGINAT